MRKYFTDIYLGIWTVLLGMKITLIHLLRPTVTLQYPEEKLYPEKKKKRSGALPILYEWSPPEGYRGDLLLKNDDCIGCMLCAQACPVDCFDIVTERVSPGEDLGKTSKGQPKKLKVLKFDIDMTKCMFCGLCVEPCPTNGLVMTKNYEFSSYNRRDLVHHFARPEKYRKKDSPGSGGVGGAAPTSPPPNVGEEKGGGGGSGLTR